MLSNAYFLAKFRFDTAENEPAKNLQNFAKFANFAKFCKILNFAKLANYRYIRSEGPHSCSRPRRRGSGRTRTPGSSGRTGPIERPSRARRRAARSGLLSWTNYDSTGRRPYYSPCLPAYSFFLAIIICKLTSLFLETSERFQKVLELH